MTQVGLEFIARDRSRAGVNSFNRNLRTASGTVLSLSRNLLAVAGVGGGMYMLGNVLRSGVREAAAFEKQMANVSTMLSDQSMSLMPRYTERLRAMSKEFGEGTETLSKGLYDILSASVAPARALDVLAVSTRAAKAGITDTGVAADAITTILNSYSLEADRAGDISDKLFSIVVRGKTTFAELAPNIGKVAALAATAGESFDDLGAVMATMTRAGVQTEIAITSLRAIILSFLKPQSDSIAMARKYGVELNSNTLRTIGLTGVIGKLKKATAEELAVIVPTSRAITGFAAAIQKSEGLASDYDFMLNSLGATEKAYQKIADTSAFKLEQRNQKWIDFKRSFGNITTGPLIAFMDVGIKGLDTMTEAAGNTKKAFEGLTKFVETHRLAPEGKQTYGMWAPMAQINAANSVKALGPSAEGAAMKTDIQRQQTLAMMAAMQMKGLSSIGGTEIKAPISAGAGAEDAAVSARTNAQIVADTREKLASIRSLDYMTRMEKIQNLKSYMAAHADTMRDVVGAETEAGKLIRQEIESITSSRLDAMKVYSAELREDMQNLALYIGEKFAEAGRSIEGSLSDSFYSMKEKGANLGTFLESVFLGIADSFARMAADMMARAAMATAINPLIGGLSAGLGGLFGGGGPAVQASAGYAPNFSTSFSNAGVPPVLHTGWVPEGVPSFARGRGLKSNEMAAVIEKDELLVPSSKIVRSAGGAGGGGSVVNNYYISAVDTQSFQQALAKNKNFLGDLNYAGLKSNSPSRRLKP